MPYYLPVNENTSKTKPNIDDSAEVLVFYKNGEYSFGKVKDYEWAEFSKGDPFIIKYWVDLSASGRIRKNKSPPDNTQDELINMPDLEVGETVRVMVGDISGRVTEKGDGFIRLLITEKNGVNSPYTVYQRYDPTIYLTGLSKKDRLLRDLKKLGDDLSDSDISNLLSKYTIHKSNSTATPTVDLDL